MSDQTSCYICYEVETVENEYAKNPRPCPCRGSIEVHKRCLNTLIKVSRNCNICKSKYHFDYLPKKDGREVIIEELNRRDVCEYTINEAGQKHGSYIIKNREGKIILYHSYINGIMEGPYIEYYPNGQMKSVCRCKNNKIEGEYVSWYKDGSLQEESYYVDGLLHGERVIWERDGYMRKDKTLIYKEGELISGDMDIMI